MKKIIKRVMALSCSILLLTGIFACDVTENNVETKEETKELWEQDLTGLNEYTQETRIEYGFAWKPSQADGFVGDPMPYYENGVYSIFYLKDEGGSLRHSVYRVDTTDFIHYEDKGEVLRSQSIGKQDYWIGTGSVVKAENDYYFFYTGYNNNFDVWEKVMVAKSEGNMDNFVRVDSFSIAPPSQYSQHDFRDPQAYYDPINKRFDITVESNYGGKARIVKYNVSLDLKQINYEGDMYVEQNQPFWNLECADIFTHNNKYYLTYSAQGNPMDTVYIAQSNSMFSGYTNHRRIEGLHFYAAKTVQNDNGDTYMVGWMYRRRDSELFYNDYASLYWGGHLVVHQIKFNENDEPYLAPVDGFDSYYGAEGDLLSSSDCVAFASGRTSKTKIANGAESYMITGDFTFDGDAKFGIILGYNEERERLITISSSENIVGFQVKEGRAFSAQMQATLESNKKYSFVYVQEGSVGLFYIEGVVGLSFRVHGINNTVIGLYSNGCKVTFENLKYNLRVKQET